jgi:hypothetical protein
MQDFDASARQVRVAHGNGSPVRALAGSRCAAWAALIVPLFDEGHVGAGVDAELGCGLVRGVVWLGIVPGQALARVPCQEVGPPAGDLGQRGQGGGPALRGRGPGGCVPAARVRDVAKHPLAIVRLRHARHHRTHVRSRPGLATLVRGMPRRAQEPRVARGAGRPSGPHAPRKPATLPAGGQRGQKRDGVAMRPEPPSASGRSLGRPVGGGRHLAGKGVEVRLRGVSGRGHRASRISAGMVRRRQSCPARFRWRPRP